jgi:hypothetical protein
MNSCNPKNKSIKLEYGGNTMSPVRTYPGVKVGYSTNIVRTKNTRNDQGTPIPQILLSCILDTLVDIFSVMLVSRDGRIIVVYTLAIPAAVLEI